MRRNTKPLKTAIETRMGWWSTVRVSTAAHGECCNLDTHPLTLKKRFLNHAFRLRTGVPRANWLPLELQ